MLQRKPARKKKKVMFYCHTQANDIRMLSKRYGYCWEGHCSPLYMSHAMRGVWRQFREGGNSLWADGGPWMAPKKEYQHFNDTYRHSTVFVEARALEKNVPFKQVNIYTIQYFFSVVISEKICWGNSKICCGKMSYRGWPVQALQVFWVVWARREWCPQPEGSAGVS